MPLSVWVVLSLMTVLSVLLTVTNFVMAKGEVSKLMIVLWLLSVIPAIVLWTKVLG